MSGFEIVGVVLGSLPLVISGLEHYSDGVETLYNMFEYEEVLENLISTFTTIDGIYHNSCKDLLDPLLLPESEKLNLLSKTGAKGWEDEELGERLQKRLGDSYLPYTCSIRRLNKRVELFKKKLELSDEMKPGQINKASARERYFRGPLRRIRVGFGADKLEKLLGDIEKDVSRVTELTQGAYKFEPQSSVQNVASKMRYWEEKRDHTRRLFEFLVSRWRCKCSTPHRASLHLSSSLEKSDTILQLLFSFDTCANPPPWNWRDVSVEPMKTSTTQILLSPPVNRRRAVAFAPGPKTSIHNVNTTEPQLGPTSDIQCLCTALTSVAAAHACIGVLSSDQGWQQRMSSTSTWNTTPEQRRLATLRQLIMNRGALSPRRKYQVASALASSILELHSTPWMTDPWTMDDVYFVGTENSGSHTVGPYVSKTFTSNSAPLTPEPAIKQQPSTMHNPIVFALGVLLLELYYGPLEYKITTDDLDAQGKETLQTKYLVANRLVSDIQQLELPGYVNAVTRCVCCRFDALSTSLDNEHFQQCFRMGVVEPLNQLIRPG